MSLRKVVLKVGILDLVFYLIRLIMIVVFSSFFIYYVVSYFGIKLRLLS